MEQPVGKSFIELAQNIQKPQLYGIIAGIVVFSLTILMLIIVMVKSGTIDGFFEQAKREAAAKKGSGTGGSSNNNNKIGSSEEREIPELYDDLIDASKTLPSKPCVPTLKGHSVVCSALKREKSNSDSNDNDEDADEDGIYDALARISDGSAQFHESAYEPAHIWRHLSFEDKSSRARDADPGEQVFPSSSSSAAATAPPFKVTSEHVQRCYSSSSAGSSGDDCSHVVIRDIQLDVPVGMVSLVDNSPRNLTVRIDNLWVTPAFQSRNLGSASTTIDVKALIANMKRRVAKEAMFVLLCWLFEESHYRRVTMEIDSRHAVMKKFAQDCGFLHEATLRKHRVVRKRSRDTEVYSITNSDWKLGGMAMLREKCGMPKDASVTEQDDGEKGGEKEEEKKKKKK